MSSVVCLLLLALQQPATTTPPPRRAAPATPTLEVRVTDRSGSPRVEARVSVVGPSLRDATTDANGVAVFKTMTAGAYRVRAESDGYFTLEKDVTVRTGTVRADFALSFAPPPPPPPEPVVAPPPPPPAPTIVTGARGVPRILSVPDLAEQSLSGRDDVKVVPVGCTGLTATRLVVLRESLPPANYDDADESLYLVAGEATLTMGAQTQALTPGWFMQVPRKTSFGIARKGRNPAIFLSQLNGRPCPAGNPETSK